MQVGKIVCSTELDDRPQEVQSTSENDFEFFASTGMNTPVTMLPNSGRREVQLPRSGLRNNFLFARKNEAARAADAAACIDTRVGTALLKNGWCRR